MILCYVSLIRIPVSKHNNNDFCFRSFKVNYAFPFFHSTHSVNARLKFSRYMLVTYKIERDAVVTIKRIQQQVASEQRIQRTSVLTDETVYDQK